MCEGTITSLRCGHTLVHFSRRCEQGCMEPSEAPPGSELHLSLDDTCSRCHIWHSTETINAHYDRQRDELTKQYRLAEPTSKEARALVRLIGRLHTQQVEALSRATRSGLRHGALDVKWPGKTEEEPFVPRRKSIVHGRNMFVTVKWTSDDETN
ncbi:hypothetical protein PpBr36_00943 [Pyricularia pennisetigena]|uniref:hypothetical protein n=1 Tax=Pyricularia pennisetigena TaxID=1578925 RepID=UPI00114E1B0B|nr:hypothetical protein PpBr36_00943 [Pyricularia pennisetigena]TLS29367.1 hypothetical protein PpBr36_00943 [Pyricularia pennisetigena]